MTQFSFDVSFQKSLFRLLIDDVSFGTAMSRFLQPSYFTNEMLSLAFGIVLKYQAAYHGLPTFDVILEEGKSLAQESVPLFQATMEATRSADLKSEEWIKSKTLEFVHRNIFVQGFQQVKTLFDRDNVQDAFAHMEKTMDLIRSTKERTPDRSMFFEEFQQRYLSRLNADQYADTISTGIPEVDAVLQGGLSIGELGAWLAYAKRGKSTMLVNLGAQAVRRGDHKVLHLVFEGSRSQTENRYDTFFAQEEYHKVKHSDISKETLQRLEHDYRMYRGKLVVRAFTEKWSYSTADIWAEMQDLKRSIGFDPKLIVVDYADLLRASGGEGRRSETDHQTAAFRELKTLAGRGYAVWTATQAQRPTTDLDTDAEMLQCRKIADSYAKVRVCDFMGSINQTLEERNAKQARLFLEIYRENEANRTVTVFADFGCMSFSAVRHYEDKVVPTRGTAPGMGYVKQVKAPF